MFLEYRVSCFSSSQCILWAYSLKCRTFIRDIFVSAAFCCDAYCKPRALAAAISSVRRSLLYVEWLMNLTQSFQLSGISTSLCFSHTKHLIHGLHKNFTIFNHYLHTRHSIHNMVVCYKSTTVHWDLSVFTGCEFQSWYSTSWLFWYITLYMEAHLTTLAPSSA